METTRDINDTAMDLLSRREHSRLELKNKLLARNFMNSEIEITLDHLEKKGWLSDKRFTEMFIEMKKNKGFGPVRIQQELIERGVSEEIISIYLLDDLDEWVNLADQVRCKRFDTSVPEDFEAKVKQIRFLQYRGFTLEQINKLF